jgi:uncharacterized protein YndB with AHSA1/START domain
MSTTSCHATFTLTRIWSASPAHVFTAWSDPSLRAKWFGGPPHKWTEVGRSLDFRTGGSEVVEGRLTDSGAPTIHEAQFHLVEPDRRIIYAHNLHRSGVFHSVTLTTIELEPAASHTRITYTEQIAFLDGSDGTAERRQDTDQQLSMLEKVLGIAQVLR